MEHLYFGSSRELATMKKKGKEKEKKRKQEKSQPDIRLNYFQQATATNKKGRTY